jgi:anionic cell wall polymer biosynthesis LytR-Cps2A-Psr (LCP) family protein
MFVKQEESTTAAPETTKVDSVSYTGRYEFFVAVTDEAKTKTLFVNVVSVDLSDKTIRVIPIDENITDSLTGLTCGKMLVENGVKNTVSFINRFYDIEIDKYVVLTENGYKSFFRAMGDITIKLSTEITYDTDDMFLELNRGENILTPDKTYKYMKYICESSKGYEKAKGNAEIVVAAFNAFYTAERFNSADNTFSIIVDYCDTDISIVDFMGAKEELEYLLPESSKEKMKVFISDNIKNDTVEVSESEKK